MRRTRSFAVLLLVACGFLRQEAFGQYRGPFPPLRAFDAERKQLREMGITNGLLVTRVTTGQRADSLGIRPGDLIVVFNDTPIKRTDDYVKVRDSLKEGAPMKMGVWRKGKLISIEGTFGNPFGIYNSDYSETMERILDFVRQGNAREAEALLNAARQNQALGLRELLIAQLLIMPAGPIMEGTAAFDLARELRQMLTLYDYDETWLLFGMNDRLELAAFIIEDGIRKWPSNPNWHEDYAATLVSLKRNDAAEAQAHFILDDEKLAANVQGYAQAIGILSMADENRGNWEGAFTTYQRALIRVQDSHQRVAPNAAIRHLYLATKMKDYEAFVEARKLVEDISARNAIAPYADSLQCYLLSLSGRTDEARAIAAVWVAQTSTWTMVFKHWSEHYPEVARAWESIKQ
jgi:tetratricopeptide (TPR) repeat protein